MSNHRHSCGDAVFISLGYIPQSATAGSYGKCMLVVLKNLSNCFPRQQSERSLPGILPSVCYCTGVNSSVLMDVWWQRVTVAHISSTAGDERLFKCWLAIHHSSSGKCLFMPFATSPVAFCLFMLSFEMCLYSQDVSPSTYVWFINVLSHYPLAHFLMLPRAFARAKIVGFLKIFCFVFFLSFLFSHFPFPYFFLSLCSLTTFVDSHFHLSIGL